MSTAARLVKLVEGLDADGVLSATKGGTGNTTGGGTSSPTISQIAYSGDDTAANPSGGQTITLTGTNFAQGAKVLINTTQVGVVTVVSATQITFTAPQLAAGSYILYVVNTNGSTAIAVPGIQYSGTPAWTTAAGTLGTVYETAPVSATVAATSDSAVSYSLATGTLPTGATLAANGTISGTSVLTNSSTTYSFTIKATDAENQDTDRSFSLTINPDVVSWSSPANSATLTGTLGAAYSSALVATSAAGKSITYSANALPAGLAISGATITGTPTTAGTSSTTLTATSAVTNRSAQVTVSWTITVAADTYFPLTTLLLNSETAAVPFAADASTNNFAVTAFGDTKPNNFNPYTPGYYSNYFAGGASDYLTASAASSQLNLPSDFTVECWIYDTGSGSLGQFAWSTSGGFSCGINAIDGGSTRKLDWRANGVAPVWGVTAITQNTWHHVAYVRSGSAFRMFLNGKLEYYNANLTTAYTSTSTNIGSANNGDATYSFKGYISNFRVVKGTAIYTTSSTSVGAQVFTPDTAVLTAITNTALLTCQSNRFIDASANALSITRTNNVTVSSFDPFVPDASYSTYGSTYLDGSGDYLTTPYTSAFNLSSGEWTIEGWVYHNSFPGTDQRLFCVDSSSSGTFGFFTKSAGSIWCSSFGANERQLSPAGSIILNTWNHIAFTKTGTSPGTIRCYINGVVTASTITDYTFPNDTCAITIGDSASQYSNANFTGYFSNVRVVKGTALYTANFTPATAPLTAVAGTSLLTCQTNQPHNNQTFLDNSSSALPVTRAGNTTQGSFSPYGANWSNYFDGSGDSLTTTGNTSLAFGTGNFTVEAWLYQTVANTYPTVLEIGNHLQSDGILFINYGTSVAIYSGAFYGTNTTTLNAWNHVAWVRSSGVLKIYVNGVGGTGVSFTNNLTTNTPYIGLSPNGGGGYTYTGYISNLRAVKGTALYTTNFTPSTQPLTAITGTSLLTCQSPSLVDNSLNAFTLTKAGDVSVQKFNPFAVVTQTPVSHSVRFDGTGDYLTVPITTNATADLTFECWFYATGYGSLDYGTIIGAGAGAGIFQLQLYNAANPNRILGYIGSTSGIGNLSPTLSQPVLNRWIHLAVVRSGSTFTMYENGVSVATATNSNSMNFGTVTQLGATGSSYTFQGYISNLRLVIGTAVYTSNFTPSTTPLTAISGTSLLTVQSPTFIDNSTNNFTISAFGNSQPTIQNPFGSTTSSTQDYSTTTFGGSGYFDGTGDYLEVPHSTNQWIGLNQDFTIECWFNATGGSGERALISKGYQGSPVYAEFGIVINSSNQLLGLTSASGGSWLATPTDTVAISNNTWNHVALVRSGTTITLYRNGVAAATSTGVGAALYNHTAPIRIGQHSSGSNFTGYISNARIVIGTALYTSNFVPPSLPLTAITNTTLLLNMDKAAIADKSGKVVLESVGDTKLSTAVKKYGSSSMYFDGTGDYLSIPNNPVFNFGTGDFTVEAWIYLPTVTRLGIIGFGSGGFFAEISTGNNIHVSQANVVDLGDFTISPAISANTWYHLAMTRSGTSMRAFINGIQQGSTLTNSTNFTATNATIVGGHPGPIILYSGYMDDLRVTRGYARYTANFTPPSQALLTK